MAAKMSEMKMNIRIMIAAGLHTSVDMNGT
jgi:hypothetical protein